MICRNTAGISEIEELAGVETDPGRLMPVALDIDREPGKEYGLPDDISRRAASMSMNHRLPRIVRMDPKSNK